MVCNGRCSLKQAILLLISIILLSELNEGEYRTIPRGVECMPVAEKEVHVMMFEPVTTVNTGSAESDRTVSKPEQV
jgi:hypothetical protein